MKIIDERGNEITNPDLTKGKLVDATETIHHDTVEGKAAVAEQVHYEIAHEYPNGGKDMKTIIDVPSSPAVEGQPAYDEQIPIQKYVFYTDDELKAIADAKAEVERLAALPTVEERLKATEDAIMAMALGGASNV